MSLVVFVGSLFFFLVVIHESSSMTVKSNLILNIKKCFIKDNLLIKTTLMCTHDWPLEWDSTVL